MSQQEALKLFETKKVRTVWDNEKERWYFAVVDVVAVLTDSVNPQAYWRKLKQRLIEEGNQTVTNCHGLKLTAADGKKRLTDMADTEQLFRIIQSIPSPKAEPFKIWMSQVASARLEQLQDPEKSIDQAVKDYKRLGYSDKWITQRIRSIEARKELTDEWQRGGVKTGQEFAMLTDLMLRTWSGLTTREYKDYKGLHKESLRDNMTNIEIALNTLAEVSATELSKQKNPKRISQHRNIAMRGGEIANTARKELEKDLGKSVISSAKASDYLISDNDVKLLDEKENEQ
ncbi:MAG: Bro-N domain-containing protein [Bacteroidales bacterium]|nr:Bro-N domain-containing protein [Bacteroidales bacterium]